jgi:hypothetical protein
MVTHVIAKNLIAQRILSDDEYWTIVEISGCEPNLMWRLR